MRNSGLAKFTSRLILLSMLFTIACPEAFSQMLNVKQKTTNIDKWDVGLDLGITQFYGDVSSHNYFQKLSNESRIGVRIYAKKMFSPALGAGVSLFSTGLQSIKDMNQGKAVNYSLGGNFDDLTVFAYANLNNLFGNYKDNRRLSVFGTLGFGVSIWNTALTNNITGAVVHSGTSDGTRKYANKALCIPVGAGLDYKINSHWAVHAGGTFTTVLSDDLDLWHDGSKYDQLFYTHVGVTYYLKPGHGSFHHRRKKNRRREPVNKQHIPIFDYMVNPGPAPVDSTKKTKLDVLVIPPKKASANQQKTKSSFQFRVQIAASRKHLDPTLIRSKYKLSYPVKEVHQDGYYLYSVGDYTTYQDALTGCRRVLLRGVQGAFVTAYLNNRRVHLTDKMMQRGFNYHEVTPSFF